MLITPPPPAESTARVVMYVIGPNEPPTHRRRTRPPRSRAGDGRMCGTRKSCYPIHTGGWWWGEATGDEPGETGHLASAAAATKAGSAGPRRGASSLLRPVTLSNPGETLYSRRLRRDVPPSAPIRRAGARRSDLRASFRGPRFTADGEASCPGDGARSNTLTERPARRPGERRRF